MSTLRLLHAIIAVKLDAQAENYGSILLPFQAREECDVGTVIAAGPGEWNKKNIFKENPVKEGDRVIIAKGAGIKIKIDDEGEELLFLTPTEITGIIR